MRPRRNDPRSARGGASAAGAALLLPLLLAVSGCSLFSDPALDEEWTFRESSLGVAEIAARIEEADRLYEEPRTVERVRRSVELCLEAVSPANGYGALWRAARGCYWLASHDPDTGARLAHARLGVRAGRAASERAPELPASHFYLALNLGRLSELEGRGVRRVPVMAELARKVIALDERYAHAGGHRFLGRLCLATMDNPLVAFGDLDDVLEHLERACELFPDYGGNQLALARALLADGEREEARRRLELVLRSPSPPGESDTHAEWIEEARRLLAELSA